MRVKVSLEIEVPDGIDYEDIEEYLQGEFGYSDECSASNPMFDEDYSVEKFFMREL